MSRLTKILLLTASLAAMWVQGALADKTTVCTITVNSPDEKEAFRRGLPADKFQFVELVEQGRSDWLASACRQQIRCDVLVVSGHYDGGNEFFSDQPVAREYLPVDEMERVSCSASCPGLFSQLKEVYLFGCNTLNAQPNKSASAEIERGFVRSGHSRANAERLARGLSERHGESSRDRMRYVFNDVPAIYGFSSVAPLGPTAASILRGYFQAGGGGEIGSGRGGGKLLSYFAGNSMVVTSGLTDADARAADRRDVCQFSDDRLSAAQRLAFVHRLLSREMAEARMFLDRIEKYSASLSPKDRQTPEVARELEAIAGDQDARARYLDFARDADQPAVRARMIALAGDLGWLSPAEQRAELTQMIADRVARNTVGAADVDLVCTLNKDHGLDQELDRLQLSPVQADNPAHAALQACLGSADARTRVVLALSSPDDEAVQVAQVYLRHQPITDVNELRLVTARVARMNSSRVQIRALETLASQRLSDPDSLEELARLFPLTESAGVQSAIAGVLIRSDYQAIATPEFVQALRRGRLKSSGGGDLIDVLIRRLQLE